MFKTPNELSKYEICRIIGLRTLQITEDSVLRFNGPAYQQAVNELLENKLEFSIRRYLPDASFEDRHVSTLHVPYSYVRDAYRNYSVSN